MRAVVLKHVAFEGPARIAELLAERAVDVDVRELYLGDPVPARLAPDQALVVMGGPMGVGDIDGTEHTFLREELALLRDCIERDAPVLGVCLGAQLLAAAAGASVYPASNASGERVLEVGWAPLQLHVATSPVLRGLPSELMMLHWHGDTFDLPHGATLLASTAACPNQAFQIGTRLFGLQFHPELGAAEIDTLLDADLAFATRANGPDARARISGDTARHLRDYRAIGDHWLRNILDTMLGDSDKIGS